MIVLIVFTYDGLLPPSYEIWEGGVKGEEVIGRRVDEVVEGRRVALFHEPEGETVHTEYLDYDIKLVVDSHNVVREIEQKTSPPTPGMEVVVEETMFGGAKGLSPELKIVATKLPDWRPWELLVDEVVKIAKKISSRVTEDLGRVD